MSFFPVDLSGVAQTATAAAQAAVPPFSNVQPKAEGGAPALGAVPMIPYADHVHPRLTATARGTLDANGNATVVFTQVFAAEPAVTVTGVGIKATGKPVPRFDVTFTQDGNGGYTGCTVYGERQRPLPTLTPLSGALTLVSGVVTGVNTALALLSGFLPTEPAAGAGFSLIAVKTSAAA